jgi:hypothetical protein
MSAFIELAKLCEAHPEIRAHKQIGSLLRETETELSELAKRNEYLESVVIGIVKSTGANTATEAPMMFSKLRSELDEARKMLDMLGLLEVTK